VLLLLLEKEEREGIAAAEISRVLFRVVGAAVAECKLVVVG
jgi:hypothetical protein